MMKKELFKYGHLLLICTFFLYCRCKEPDNTPNVSNIKISLQTARFDEDLYEIDTNHIGAGLQKLSLKYPDFLNFYLDTILSYDIHRNYSDTVKGIREGLHAVLTYKDYVNLEDTIKRYYPDTKEADAQLVSGFQFMKYYFPQYRIPKVMYINLNLNKLPAITVDSTILGICLDMLLGPQFPYYRSVGVPDYMLPHVSKSYLPVAAFGVIYNSRYPFIYEDRTLLDMMIQRGKQQYFLHKILPHTPDSILFAFSQLQLDWCAANQESIYNFFQQQQLLYNKEPNSVMPYVNDGPFAQGLESVTDPVKSTPGNIGTWLGYKIICAYMAEHPETTLSDLLEKQTDPVKILNDARYKPKDARH